MSDCSSSGDDQSDLLLSIARFDGVHYAKYSRAVGALEILTSISGLFLLSDFLNYPGTLSSRRARQRRICLSTSRSRRTRIGNQIAGVYSFGLKKERAEMGATVPVEMWEYLQCRNLDSTEKTSRACGATRRSGLRLSCSNRLGVVSSPVRSAHGFGMCRLPDLNGGQLDLQSSALPV